MISNLKNKPLTFILLLSILLTIGCNDNGQTFDRIDLIPVKSDGKWQYIDVSGNIVINPQFSHADIFCEERAAIILDGDSSRLYGFIDQTGKIVIQPEYINVGRFNEGLAIVCRENGHPQVIDVNGKQVFEASFAERLSSFSEGVASFQQTTTEDESKWGFVDKNGGIIVSPQFSQTLYMTENLCAVRNSENKWGFINSEGKLVITHQFDEVSNFQNGFATVKFGDKCGIINREGKYVVNPQFEDLFHDGKYFIFKLNDKYGWCDNQGSYLINPQFKEAFLFGSNDVAPVKSGDKWGYINRDGKYVINPQYDNAWGFLGKIAPVKAGEKYGFIKEGGLYEINPQFESVSRTVFMSGVNIALLTAQDIRSDFLDLKVFDDIDFSEPEGISVSSSYGSLITKFDVTKSSFKKYNHNVNLTSFKNYKELLSTSLVAYGTPYEYVSRKVGNGWYSYNTYDYVYSKLRSPVSLTYTIYPRGKMYGKLKKLMGVIDGDLTGYKRSNGDDNSVIYTNENTRIKVVELDWRIEIEYSKL